MKGFFLPPQAEGTEMTKNYNWLLCPKGQYGLCQEFQNCLKTPKPPNSYMHFLQLRHDVYFIRKMFSETKANSCSSFVTLLTQFFVPQFKN